MSKEFKNFGGRIKEIKEIERNGEPVGILAGYIATWDIDRGSFGMRDQFVRGAFSDSIRQHQVQDRPIRMKDQHFNIIGGFPINEVHEDEVGLFGIGEVNLTMERGREIMSLARQGVLTDFSIGFSVTEFTEDEGLRRITKATIWEGSVVDEPMNPKARITSIKGFHNLPIAPESHEWVYADACKRVEDHKDAEKAFIGDTLVADVIDGELMIIPSALEKLIKSGNHVQDIERYYAKMGADSPYDTELREFFTEKDVKDWTPRMIEKVLIKSGMFSRSASAIISGIDKTPSVDQNTLDVLTDMKKLLS